MCNHGKDMESKLLDKMWENNSACKMEFAIPLHQFTRVIFQLFTALPLRLINLLPGAPIIVSGHQKEGPFWCFPDEIHHLPGVVCGVNHTAGYSWHTHHVLLLHLHSWAFLWSQGISFQCLGAFWFSSLIGKETCHSKYRKCAKRYSYSR